MREGWNALTLVGEGCVPAFLVFDDLPPMTATFEPEGLYRPTRIPGQWARLRYRLMPLASAAKLDCSRFVRHPPPLAIVRCGS